MQTHFILVACLVTLLSVAAAYQYLVHRVDGKCQAKAFFVPAFEKLPFILCITTLALAVCTYFYSTLIVQRQFIRALMNAEVLIWLVLLGYIDLREKIIPNALILVGLAFWGVLALIDIFVAHTPWLELLKNCLFGGLLVGGLLLLIALISKSALGMGDVKMFFVLGLLYGVMDTYALLLFSMIIMAVISLILLACKKVTTKTKIPMAPFVTIGFLLSIAAGL